MVKITFEDNTQSPQQSTQGGVSGAVEVSATAAAQIQDILERKHKREGGEKPNFLRVRVDGGGCNGYTYKFLFETAKEENDIAIEKNGVTVLIDALSYNYLQGSLIDYVETLEASQFTISNPNATSQCGCGNSFGL